MFPAGRFAMFPSDDPGPPLRSKLAWPMTRTPRLYRNTGGICDCTMRVVFRDPQGHAQRWNTNVRECGRIKKQMFARERPKRFDGPARGTVYQVSHVRVYHYQ